MPDNRIIRLLDANFNRAREGLRVMEDAARFVLDDPALTETAKQLRHRLTATALSLPVAARFSLDRDTTGDVGTSLTVPTEQDRQDLPAVLNAEFGRVTEALRALEEYSKLLEHSGLSAQDSARETGGSLSPQSSVLSPVFKQIRYEVYTFHANLLRRLQPNTAISRLKLYVLITADLCHDDWLTVAEQALAGGADCLQLREKDLDDAELLRRAKKLADLCHRYSALFIMNDRPDIAVLAGADGVHVGQDDLPIAAIRRFLGLEAIIGMSTHTVDQALAAANEAPDYIAVGPMYPTSTKPQDHIAGVETLRQIAARTKIPLVAIGGITPENAPEIITAGAQAVAVCQAVIAQPNPTAAVQAFRKSLEPNESP